MIISFKRQYNCWLFPGESDTDESLKGYIEDGVQSIIDSVNPLTLLRVCKRAREFAPRVVAFPWWHVYWAPCCFKWDWVGCPMW
jgi:hypothetical protein